MGAIFGQGFAAIAAVVVAALLFAHTSLNLWPVYALAAFCGASRPAVNRALNEFAGAGMLELGRGRLRVVDEDKLNRKAGKA